MPAAAQPEPSHSAWFLTRRMMGLAWRHRVACLWVVLLNGSLVLFNVGGLGLTGLAIDYLRATLDATSPPPHWPLGLAPPANWSPMTVVTTIAGAVLVVALSGAALRFATAVAGAALSQRVLVELRSGVYDKLQRLSFTYFDAHSSSSLINRAAGDVNAVRMFVDGVIIKVLGVVLTLAVCLGYMLSVHVTLTLVCLATSPLLWIGAVMFSRIVQPAYRRASELSDDLILSLVENVQGIHVVKGFAREREQIERFRTANGKVHDEKRGIFWKIALYQPAMGIITQFNMLVLIGFGGYLVVKGQLQLGAGLFVFANLLHEFANQVAQITNIANTIQSSLTGAERVFEVLDAPVAIASAASAQKLPRAKGEICFDRVTFAYGDEPVLRDLSFTVRAGECLGIVGETGAGKSTLLSLLARFYDVDSGAITIDGVDIRQIDLDDLRRNIGIVFQESFVFSNTVAANIAFGQPDAQMHEIERAASIAAADEFIDDLTDGYHTVVGEYGSNLSGGQRQRLAIARALLLDPPILLLDDATASVDPQTEHDIREAMESALNGRTTLLVSSRIRTLRHAHQIIVLDKGHIVEQGRHEDLMRAGGIYRRLAELQFAEQVDEAPSSAPEPVIQKAG